MDFEASDSNLSVRTEIIWSRSRNEVLDTVRFNVFQMNSMGLNWGLYGGRNIRRMSSSEAHAAAALE